MITINCDHCINCFYFKIESEAAEGLEQSNKTLERVLDLNERMGDVKVKFTENQINVAKATTEAEEADRLANEAVKVTIK